MSKISQTLDLRQSQQLVMTPQLQQAIKLLQLNNMELAEFIEEEIAQNPLLEKADNSEEQTSENHTENHAEDTAENAQENENQSDDVQAEFDEAWAGNETANSADAQSNDFDTGSQMATIGAGGNTSFDNNETSFENQMSEHLTLREHLNRQLSVQCSDSRDHMIGLLLIDQLDETGYLRSDTEELADKLGCSRERLEKVLDILKSFDPAGVFAKDLNECLALQLKEQGRYDAPMQKLIENLDMLGNHDMQGLAEKCGVNPTYLADMVAEIKELNPKPAGSFDHVIVQTAIPDVVMKKLPKNLGGGWKIELNTETLPRVLVNQEYYTQVSSKAKSKADREYIVSQLGNANWLVKAMDQRAQTILKVASEIVEQQDAFFYYGIEFLKPLTLKDIAEEIDMHESTVSRVTTNKYIGTPRGIFELKYFFTTALTSSDGTAHSSESIKARIKTLIDEEDPKKVLSDDKLVNILQEEGIDIARRTVAKYREAMHIPSSVQRRKQKKNQM